MLGGLMFIFPEALLGNPEAGIGGRLGTRGGSGRSVFRRRFERHRGYGLRGAAMGAAESEPGSTLVSNQRLLTTKALKMQVPHVRGLKQRFEALTRAKWRESGNYGSGAGNPTISDGTGVRRGSGDEKVA